MKPIDTNTVPEDPGVAHPNPVRGPALVSIGLPVRNAVTSVAQAIASALEQEHLNLELIIADNASDDGTSDICRDWAAKDPRIRYIRHPDDIGAAANFRTVLSRARGEYFAWLGGDDVLLPEFVSATLGEMNLDDSLVGCSCIVAWSHGELAPGSFAITGTPRRRVVTFLRHARDNSRFYGLFRRDVLARWFPDDNFYGFDLAVMAGTLTEGDHGCVEEILVRRARSDPSSYLGANPDLQEPWVDRWLPMWPMTRFLLRESSLTRRPSALWWLAVRNLYEAYKAVGRGRDGAALLAGVDRWVERIRARIVTRS